MDQRSKTAFALFIITILIAVLSFKIDGKVFNSSRNMAAIVGAGSGLVSWWKMDGDTTDSMGSHNGTLNGSPTFVSGKFGQAISLNGTNQDISFDFDPFASGDITACAWVNPTTIGGTPGSILSTVYFDFVLQNIGDTNYVSVSSNASNAAMAVGPGPNAWHHICTTRPADGNNTIMYADGSAIGSGFSGPPTTYFTLHIGGKTGGTQWFPGLIDDVRIYNRILSAAEIQEVYLDVPTAGGGSYTVTASAGTGGTISPSGSVSVTANTDQNFTITPQSGYKVGSVTVDGNLTSVSETGGTYSFPNVSANHTISATFLPTPTYTSIPSDRIMDWSVAGITGGIPERTTVCAAIVPSPASPQVTHGSTNAGSAEITVTDASNFQIGQGISVEGAAFQQWTTTPGATLHSVVVSIQGSTITLGNAADASVTNALVTHDDASAIQYAIDHCPAGQVVYAPAANYTLSRGINSSSHANFVLRGDGPGRTKFSVGSGTAFTAGAADWPPPSLTVPIISGATKGSTSVTIDPSSASSISVGGLIKIGAGTNPPYVKNIGVSGYDEQLSMTFLVTSKTSDSVTFTPALPFDFSSYSPSLGIYQVAPTVGVGFEDFTIDLLNTGTYGIEMSQMWGSWVKNVEIKNSNNHVMSLYAVSKSEFRHNYFHDTQRAGPNTEGFDFYRDSAWNLVEDNIIYNAGGLVIGDWQGGSSGNVISSNFIYGTQTGDSAVAGFDIDVSHGSNNILNLIEGNVAGQIMADGYFGSVSHDLIARNWLTATHPTGTSNLYAIRLKHFSDHFTAIGNILGTNAFPTSGSLSGGYAYGGFYEAPQISGYDNGWSTGVQSIYELGFPNIGNSSFSGSVGPSDPIDYSTQGPGLNESQALDLNVIATFLRHGNYDYFNRAITWDPNIADHSIPSSYYRSSKPAFFGSLAWPAFDPSTPPGAFSGTTASVIPAAYRYYNPGSEAPGVDSASTPLVINGVCGATNNACAVGSLSDSADSATQYLWSCVGSNGGTTASCSLSIPISPAPPATPTPSASASGKGGGGGGGSTAVVIAPAAQSSADVKTTLTSSVQNEPVILIPSTVVNSNLSPVVNTAERSALPLSFSHSLFFGVSGKEVRALQKLLNQSGYAVAVSGPGSLGRETEVYGTSTKKAVERFQEENGIAKPGDSGYGIVGPATKEKLNSLLISSPINSVAPPVPSSDSDAVVTTIAVTKYPSIITRGLQFGMIDPSVITLQKILNSDTDTVIASSGMGAKGYESTYFGKKTEIALGRFQEKYGLAKPGDVFYGYAGPATRDKLNEIAKNFFGEN